MGSVIPTFFEIECLLRLYHWNTTSFARHKASCDAIAAVTSSMDTIVETLLGKFGRTKIVRSVDLEIEVPTDANIVKSLDSFCKYLAAWNSVSGLNSPDVLNFRDDLLGSLHRVQYLMTLS